MRALARERSAVAEAARLVRRSAGDLVHQRDTSDVRALDPVVFVPGFMAGDFTLLLMSRHLRKLGHRTYRSTMHANVRCTQEATDALERRVEAITIKRGRKVTIVGHSLGGMLARALAARRPDLVDGAITLGSPMLAPGAVHTVLALNIAMVIALRRAGLGQMMGEDCTSGDCARLSWEQAQSPLHKDIAFTSVFSRRDGLIDWRACLDPAARTVEVTTSHVGMAIDPLVFDIVASTLEQNRVRRQLEVRSPAKLAVVPGVSVG